jgi:hypothetical protein
MIRIAVHHSNLLDNTSFYRAWGPLNALCQTDKRYELLGLGSQSAPCWPDILNTNVCFFHRPFTYEHVEIIEKYRKMKIPVWIDYDDDFFNLLLSSPSYSMIMNQANQSLIRHCLEIANMVTVTNEYLFSQYKPFVRNRIEVVENALPDRLASLKRNEPSKKTILWRGNIHHVEDLESVEKEILQVAKENKDWSWVFMGGYKPYRLQEEFHKEDIHARYLNNVPDVLDYFTCLTDLNPKILIVPLVDKPFNHGKSNIAWIEGTLAGAKCVVPDWPEWRKPGACWYKEFGKALSIAIEGRAPINNEDSWKYISENLMLSRVNEKREKIIQEVLDAKV